MNDSLINDSLNSAKNIIVNSSSKQNLEKWWMWIAIIELLIITYLIIKIRSKAKDSFVQKIKKDTIEQEIDFDNIINSSFNSIALYDELKVKCHPDRFVANDKLNEVAGFLFQEITKNKTNYKRLTELKEEAISKLGIKF